MGLPVSSATLTEAPPGPTDQALETLTAVLLQLPINSASSPGTQENGHQIPKLLPGSSGTQTELTSVLIPLPKSQGEVLMGPTLV